MIATNKNCTIDPCILVNILYFVNIYNGIHNILLMRVQLGTLALSITHTLYLNLQSLLSTLDPSKMSKSM